MIKSNGGIIGPDNVTTGGPFGSASGVFKLGEVTDLIKDSKWPTAGPQGYQSANSCRFNSGSSDYLNRTPSSTSNRKTFTFSFWVKRTTLGTNDTIYNVRPDSNGANRISFHSTTNTFRIALEPINKYLFTNRVFRDVSAWYHIVAAFDTTQATASNRVKLYVNGVQETSFSTATYPDQDADLDINTQNVINLGRDLETSSDFIDMYLAEFVFIDGQSLAPTSFGEENSQTGIWVPKSVTGLTFGTNGFYLPFTNASALGEDFSGNDNDFTVNNLTSIDQSIDTCTNNFATFNTLYRSGATFSQGNLQYQAPASNPVFGSLTTMAVNSGKWYAEVKYTAGSNHYLILGVADYNFSILGGLGSTNNDDLGKNGTTGSIAYVVNTGAYRVNNSNTSWGSAGGDGDIIQMAIDKDNQKIYFGVNGTWGASSNPATGSNGIDVSSVLTGDDWFWGVTNDTGASETIAEFNFGSPSYSISSGNTDGNGFGNFEYAVPSGYLALCTNNLNV